MYKTLSICGLRGFAQEQTLYLAIPNGKKGSGLTVVVGANNSGKSTIWEAFRTLSSSHSVSFTEGKRNQKAGNKVLISITDTNNEHTSVQTVSGGGSETKKTNGSIKCFSLQSRRGFNPFFSQSKISREKYVKDLMSLPGMRASNNDYFSSRLFEINTTPGKKEKFNEILFKVLGYSFNWFIEQNDQGNYYLKLTFNGSSHNSDGAGEGLLSAFTIIDALYDSDQTDLIVIDEPELSLHPALQRHLFDLLLTYAQDRQIVIFTHSPFFINWEAIVNGAEFVRTCKEDNKIRIYQLSQEGKNCIAKFTNDQHNLHTLGLEANETFFLDDNIILTEGQDDVFYYKKYFETRCPDKYLNFFGWGVGGADKMRFMAQILKDLGYKKVIGIVDSDKIDMIPELRRCFPEFKFFSIPALDVRDKAGKAATEAKTGLFASVGILKEQYTDEMNRITNDIFAYLE